jgi:hypothetical protein
MTNRFDVIEYRGQRVLTLAMIDQLHRRPRGAASRSFRHYRQHFVEGEDYFVVDGSGAVPGIRKGTPLFTKEGYLKVTLPFNNDLSWRIHREVVTAYIRGREAANASALSPLGMPPGRPAPNSSGLREREVHALPWGVATQEGWAK